jgi:hypothetical protein
MKALWIAAGLALVGVMPAIANSWSPQSVPDATLIAVVALGFLAIAGAMRGRRL